LEVLCWLVRAAILKSEGVLAVFFQKFKNTLKEIFQVLMLASAYEDTQQLIWNF